jgi:hypothetical protein
MEINHKQVPNETCFHVVTNIDKPMAGNSEDISRRFNAAEICSGGKFIVLANLIIDTEATERK